LSKLVFILSFLLCSSSFASIENKCAEIQSDQNSEKFVCYGLDTGPEVSEKLKQVKTLSTSLQEWLWLNDKLEKGIQENKEKKQMLEETKQVFSDSIAGYPDEKKFLHQFKMVENYKMKYEELYQATKKESSARKWIQSCFGPGGNTCPPVELNDYKIELAKYQAKKLTILMSYPLLSSAIFKESIEGDQADFVNFRAKKKDGHNNIGEFEEFQKNERKMKFSNLMLKGIDDIDAAMKKRDEKWRRFQHKYNKVGIKNFIDKSKTKVGSFHVRETVARVQREESGIINEVLLGIDLDKEVNNPYLGKAICQIRQRQDNQVSNEERSQMILDGTLMIAPFFLGPLGAAARLASMGRIASWGVKGRYLAAGAVEGSLLGYDQYEISKKTEQCQNNYINSLGHNKDLADYDRKIKLTKSCEEDLEQQIFFSIAGAALMPVAFIGGKSLKAMGKFSKESQSLAQSLNRAENSKQLKGVFDEFNLPKSDRVALEKEFEKLQGTSKLNREVLLVKFRKDLQERLKGACSL
jgi:hypothetical protein